MLTCVKPDWSCVVCFSINVTLKPGRSKFRITLNLIYQNMNI